MESRQGRAALKRQIDPNRQCINCGEVDSTHVVLWLGAFVCSECADLLEQDSADELRYTKVRIKKLNDLEPNIICQKFVDLGGNWRLKNYMD